MYLLLLDIKSTRANNYFIISVPSPVFLYNLYSYSNIQIKFLFFYSLRIFLIQNSHTTCTILIFFSTAGIGSQFSFSISIEFTCVYICCCIMFVRSGFTKPVYKYRKAYIVVLHGLLQITFCL